MRNILALLSSFVSNICAIVHRSHTLSTPSGESRRQSSLFRMAVLGWSSVFERSLHMRCPLFLPYKNHDSTQILTRLPLFFHHTERPSLPSTWSTPSSALAALSTVSVLKRSHHPPNLQASRHSIQQVVGSTIVASLVSLDRSLALVMTPH